MSDNTEDRGVRLLREAWNATAAVTNPDIRRLLHHSLIAAAAQHPDQAAILPELLAAARAALPIQEGQP